VRRLLWIALVGLVPTLALLGVPARATHAQTTDGEPAFVYGINAAIPDNYVGTFAPPAAGTIYLLAGETSIISPRMTEIYFWPITNEFRANWSALNEPVPGTLEITQNGQLVASLEATDYTIQFTQEDLTTRSELFTGPEAVAADEDFRARQQAFQEASIAYNEAEREWLDAAARAAQDDGDEAVELPPAPEPPQPIGVFSNGLNHGMAVNLAPGQYAIRLRGPDGATVPGSERALTVFTARRTGAGYTVVPETRWTTPLESPAPSDVIFGTADSTLYLEPHLAREYPAGAWALLQNPQRSGSGAGGWEWVNGERLSDGTLELIAGDRVVEQSELAAFEVRQSPGSRLGYEVVPFVADAGTGGAPTKPDIEAYPLQLPSAGERFQVRLTTAQGEVLPGSNRQVNVPANPPLSRLLILPAAPLLLGALLITRRQQRNRSRRALAAEK
jgi:hypothetical protein